MKNLPQTEWIETETKEKNKQEKTGQEKYLKWKRWNKIFDDDVPIVYCNAPNVKWRKGIGQYVWNWWSEEERNKSDYCLTSERAEIKL